LALLTAADDIRGFGPVKEAAFSEYRKRCEELATKLDGPASSNARIAAEEIHE